DTLKSWVGISLRYKEDPTGETIETALRHTLVDGEVKQESHPPTESAFDAWHNIMTNTKTNGSATLNVKPEAAPPHSVEEPRANDAGRRRQLERFPVEWQSFLALATGPASEYHFEVLRHAR